ncbi:MAG: hypothetical protein IKO11_08755, partial [Lachnospiraceae bacterium]|nr:hypothetical protein [Lachnospiraceae bacterium]
MGRKDEELLRQQEQQRQQRIQQQIMAEETQQEELFSQGMMHSFVSRQQDAAPAGPALVRDIKKSQGILSKCKKRLFPASCGETAEGTPVQAPVQERGIKQRAKDSWHGYRTRKKSGWAKADYHTYEIEKALTEQRTEIQNSTEAAKKFVPGFSNGEGENGIHFDERILLTYMKGYKKDKNGEPLNEEEAAKRDADVKLVQDYASGDYKRREPFLRSATDELLNLRLDMSMFSDEYLSTHYREVFTISDKILLFENIMKDPLNKPFFDAMEPLEKKLLDVRALDFIQPVNAFMDTYTRANYVDMNLKKIIPLDPSVASVMEDAKKDVKEFIRPMLEQTIQAREQKEKDLYAQGQAESYRKALKDAEVKDSDLSGAARGGTDAFIKMHTALLDNKGKNVIKVSDRCRDRNLVQREFLQATAEPLVELGIRSAGATADAYKELRGTLFKTMNDDYKAMFESIHAQGLPFEQMQKMIKKVPISKTTPAKYGTGGGLEAMATAMLPIFRRRVETAEFVRFLEDNYVLYGGAKVFAGNFRDFVSFQMQQVLTREVGVSKGVAPPEMFEFINLTNMTLMALPRLDELKGEEREKLAKENPELDALVKEYSEMVDSLTEKLRQGAVKEPVETGEGDSRQSFVSQRGATISQLVGESSREKIGDDVALQRMAVNDYCIAYRQKAKEGKAPDLEGGSGDALRAEGELNSLIRVMKLMLPENYASDLLRSTGGDVFDAVTQIGNDLRMGGALQELGDLLESCRAAFTDTPQDFDEEASAILMNLFMKQVIQPAMAEAGGSGEAFGEMLTQETKEQSRSEEYRDRGWLLQSLNTQQRSLERDKDLSRRQEEYAKEQEVQKQKDEIASLDAKFAEKAAQIADDAHNFEALDVQGRKRSFISKEDYMIYNRMLLATPEMIAGNPLLQEAVTKNFNTSMNVRIKEKGKFAFRDSTPEILALNKMLSTIAPP